MKVTEPEDGLPRDLGVPDHPSSHAISRLQGRGGQAWPQGSTGDSRHTLNTCPWHDGICGVVLWLPKDPRSYQAGTWGEATLMAMGM